MNEYKLDENERSPASKKDEAAATSSIVQPIPVMQPLAKTASIQPFVPKPASPIPRRTSMGKLEEYQSKPLPASILPSQDATIMKHKASEEVTKLDAPYETQRLNGTTRSGKSISGGLGAKLSHADLKRARMNEGKKAREDEPNSKDQTGSKFRSMLNKDMQETSQKVIKKISKDLSKLFGFEKNASESIAMSLESKVLAAIFEDPLLSNDEQLVIANYKSKVVELLKGLASKSKEELALELVKSPLSPGDEQNNKANSE